MINFVRLIINEAAGNRTDFLIPYAFWNISDFGAKCEKCETINTITLEKGVLKKQE